jgi:hypothetical protein
MIDLIHFVKNFNPYSSHHHAAFNELARHIPKDQMNRDSEWVTIYRAEESEWGVNELKEHSY